MSKTFNVIFSFFFICLLIVLAHFFMLETNFNSLSANDRQYSIDEWSSIDHSKYGIFSSVTKYRFSAAFFVSLSVRSLRYVHTRLNSIISQRLSLDLVGVSLSKVLLFSEIYALSYLANCDLTPTLNNETVGDCESSPPQRPSCVSIYGALLCFVCNREWTSFHNSSINQADGH